MTDYIRIRVYDDGKYVGEHLYKGDSQVRAIERFRTDMPELDRCILVAENYDSTDPESKEHFEVCKQCGCVHGLFR